MCAHPPKRRLDKSSHFTTRSPQSPYPGSVRLQERSHRWPFTCVEKTLSFQSALTPSPVHQTGNGREPIEHKAPNGFPSRQFGPDREEQIGPPTRVI